MSTRAIQYKELTTMGPWARKTILDALEAALSRGDIANEVHGERLIAEFARHSEPGSVIRWEA